ncbi:MAG: GerMN domain-containing protein [Acidimicrobiales bacterium]|jgi:spore germination protein GerM
MTGARLRWITALAVAGVVLSGAACGIPTASAPTPIAKSDVPYHLLEPPTTNSSVPGSAPAVGVPEQIFLVAPSGHLVAATREVAVPAALGQVLGALLAGPTATESASGVQSYLSGAGVGVTTTQAGGIATVRFTADPIQVVGPDQTMAIAQVVYTVTQQPGITGVDFEIAGKAVEVPTAAGAQVPGPVGRTDYLPQAPLP